MNWRPNHPLINHHSLRPTPSFHHSYVYDRLIYHVLSLCYDTVLILCTQQRSPFSILLLVIRHSTEIMQFPLTLLVLGCLLALHSRIRTDITSNDNPSTMNRADTNWGPRVWMIHFQTLRPTCVNDLLSLSDIEGHVCECFTFRHWGPRAWMIHFHFQTLRPTCVRFRRRRRFWRLRRRRRLAWDSGRKDILTPRSTSQGAASSLATSLPLEQQTNKMWVFMSSSRSNKMWVQNILFVAPRIKMVVKFKLTLEQNFEMNSERCFNRFSTGLDDAFKGRRNGLKRCQVV